MAKYQLTDNDIEILKSMGNSDEDIHWIRKCINDDGMICESRNGRKVSLNTALKRLGRDEFLSGLSRATFHWSCERGEDENLIYFDSSEWHNR